MADALVSTPVAVVAGVASVALIAVAGNRIKKENRDNSVALMGVMGAFVFAAQMINFTIPGTGSSGHIVGGVLLAAMLGPWSAFLTLASVLIIQCLVFADGGLMALGCNILNMGAMTCLVAYPLVFKPLIRYPASSFRIFGVSILACIVGLELGAVMVTIETVASGITALPASKFLLLMTSIHLAIGLGEGVATGAVLAFVQKMRPSVLYDGASESSAAGKKRLMIVLISAVVLLGGVMCFFASENPDGLEWSIASITGSTDLAASDVSVLSSAAERVQTATAVMPDYENTFSGILGAAMVMALVWAFSSILFRNKRRATAIGREHIQDKN